MSESGTGSASKGSNMRDIQRKSVKIEKEENDVKSIILHAFLGCFWCLLQQR